MKSMRVCVITLLGMFCALNQATAGPVLSGSGGVNVSYEDVVGGADSASFDVSFPGAATVSYDGTALDPEVPIGDERGDAGATYNLQDLADGALFDVSVFHTNRGDEQRTLGGDVDFDFTFTTDRSLNYTFTTDPTGPANAIVASFAGVEQDLHIDVFGTASGTLLENGAPVARTVQGVLPAGTHALSLSLLVVNGRSTTGGGGNAAVSIALAEADPPVAIPLPAGAWTGLSALLVCGIAVRLRRTWRPC